jgi:hypothetical protein
MRSAYFHRPDDLRAELVSAGFDDVRILAIEGVGGFGLAEHHLDDPAYRRAALRAIRRIEDVPELLGASPHLMGIARH